MRSWVWFLFFALTFVSLHGAILYEEDFTDVTSLDSIGWIPSTYTPWATWDISNTNHAGGTAPELEFSQTSLDMVISDLTSPKIPVNGAEDITISFIHILHSLTGSSGLMVEMSTKVDDGSWIVQWVDNYTAGDSLSGAPTVGISTAGADSLQIKFSISCFSYITCDWRIDNIVVKEDDLYITDEVWTITEDTLIDSSRMLYVSGDSEIRLTGGSSLTIEGGVEVIGDPDNPIEISLGYDNPSFAGLIKLESPAFPCSFTHCHFKDKLDTPHLVGGGVDADNVQDLIFDSCLFEGLMVPGFGGGVIAYSSTLSFNDCEFIDCFVTEGGAVHVQDCNLTMTGGTIAGCQGTNRAAAIYGAESTIDVSHVLVHDCGHFTTGKSIFHFSNLNNVTLDHLTIADCDVTTRGIITMGDSTSVNLSNSIVWNNNNDATFWIGQSTTFLHLDYVDHNGSTYNNGGTSSGNHVLQDDPLFADSTNGDYTLSEDSPCIDAGDPDYLPLDPDYTITDLGYAAFYQSKPVIRSITDIPDDQGRQVQCVWRACLHDTTGVGGVYDLWRWDEVFARDGEFINDYAQLAPHRAETPQSTIYMLRDDMVWCYLGSVPAYAFDNYAVVVPTLQDSSSTGTNETTCKLVYANDDGQWWSNEASGYSLDNIPPMSPEEIALTRSGDEFTLQWSEVTEGELNGNSYPEQNGVWYRVYASDTPDFVCDETTLLLVTQDLSLIYSGDDERRFFKVVAADQQ